MGFVISPFENLLKHTSGGGFMAYLLQVGCPFCKNIRCPASVLNLDILQNMRQEDEEAYHELVSLGGIYLFCKAEEAHKVIII